MSSNIKKKNSRNLIKESRRLTSSQVEKADLRETKALSELASVVFCDRTVFTNPSKTLSFSTTSSDSTLSPCSARTPSTKEQHSLSLSLSFRYLRNSRGKPWRFNRSSLTDRHSSEVGEEWAGYGSVVEQLKPLTVLIDLARGLSEWESAGGSGFWRRLFLPVVFFIVPSIFEVDSFLNRMDPYCGLPFSVGFVNGPFV